MMSSVVDGVDLAGRDISQRPTARRDEQQPYYQSYHQPYVRRDRTSYSANARDRESSTIASCHQPRRAKVTTFEPPYSRLLLVLDKSGRKQLMAVSPVSSPVYPRTAITTVQTYYASSTTSMDDSKIDYTSLLDLEGKLRRFSEAEGTKELRELARVHKLFRHIQRQIHSPDVQEGLYAWSGDYSDELINKKENSDLRLEKWLEERRRRSARRSIGMDSSRYPSARTSSGSIRPYPGLSRSATGARRARSQSVVPGNNAPMRVRSLTHGTSDGHIIPEETMVQPTSNGNVDRRLSSVSQQSRNNRRTSSISRVSGKSVKSRRSEVARYNKEEEDQLDNRRRATVIVTSGALTFILLAASLVTASFIMSPVLEKLIVRDKLNQTIAKYNISQTELNGSTDVYTNSFQTEATRTDIHRINVTILDTGTYTNSP